MKETLIDKYLNGETSLAEERELLHLLQTMPTDSLTKEERTVRMMLSYTKTSIETIQSKDDGIFTSDMEEEYDRIVNRRKRRIWWKYIGIAASVALVVTIGTIGLWSNTVLTDDLAVAYVYGKETTDEELVMSIMENTMNEMLSSSTTDEKLYELFNPE
ncbi:MAG: hypothetical protein J1F40_03805 [Prevotellaceae bacterium]|nr:hypothetical protein [Prevotellaceae bacterium]